MDSCRECDQALAGGENFCPSCGLPDPSGPIRVSDLEVVLSDPLSSFLSPMAIREVGSDGTGQRPGDLGTGGPRGLDPFPDRRTVGSDPSAGMTPDGDDDAPAFRDAGREPGPTTGAGEGDGPDDDDDLEPVTWVVMGLRAQDRGEVAEALACFDNALELDRGFVRAWFHKGFVLGLMGQHRQALEAFRSAIELDPRVAKAWNNMGVTHTLLEEHDEAVEAFERALALKPDRFETLYNLGIAHATLDNHLDALEAFERALKLEGLHHQAWFNRGMVMLRLGRHLEAVVSFDRALELRPAFPEALVARERAHLHAGDPRAARESAQRALEFDAAYHPARKLQGEIDRKWGASRRETE